MILETVCSRLINNNISKLHYIKMVVAKENSSRPNVSKGRRNRKAYHDKIRFERICNQMCKGDSHFAQLIIVSKAIADNEKKGIFGGLIQAPLKNPKPYYFEVQKNPTCVKNALNMLLHFKYGKKTC